MCFESRRSFLGKGPNGGLKHEGGTKIVGEVIESEDDEDVDTDSDIAEEYDEDEDNGWDQPRSSASTPQRSSRGEAREVERQRQEYGRSESTSDDIRVGSRVEGRYRGASKYYPGKITRVRLDGTYDIEYDDGECESRVPKSLIRIVSDNGDRARGNVGAGQGAVYKRAESVETPRETPRMQRPTPIAVKQSRY